MDQLENLFKILKNEYNKSAKDLASWIKETLKKKGFSEPTITNIRKEKKEPKFTQLQAYAQEYIEHCHKVKNEKGKYVSRKSIPKIELYYNRRFFLYFYDEIAITKQPCISRAILNIGDSEKRVSIENVNWGLNTDYQGEVSIHPDGQHLIFMLRTTKTGEKNLYMNFVISPELVPPIAVGQYCSIDKKGALISGSIIFERIDNNQRHLEAKTFFVGAPAYEKLNIYIRKFLASKELNYMKVTTGIYSYEDLRLFFIRQNAKPQKSIHAEVSAGIFIAAPMNSIADEYMAFRNAMIPLVELIKSIFKCEVYFAGEDKLKKEDFSYPPVSFENNIKILDKMDRFILIYPQRISSSVLVEAGWALKAGKKCLFFVKNEEDLPFLLQNLEYPKVRVIVYEDIKDIMNLFKKHEGHIFKNY